MTGLFSQADAYFRAAAGHSGDNLCRLESNTCDSEGRGVGRYGGVGVVNVTDETESLLQ